MLRWMTTLVSQAAVSATTTSSESVRSLPEGEDGGASEDDNAGVPGGRVRHHHQLRVREKPT